MVAIRVVGCNVFFTGYMLTTVDLYFSLNALRIHTVKPVHLLLTNVSEMDTFTMKLLQ